MSRNRTNKKIPEFDFSFNDISFCNDKKIKPFIEAFIQEPGNINQQGLGTIFGIFEITDTSEDSSYITNYLISVIKKEYFSKPKRGAIESFEAALHKANLALSKLAEHGNVAWIGKINILCAALERYNLHITQIGTCHAFLLREKNLTDISDGLSTDEDRLNPLKTFTDVSSGKIQENDKLVISTDNIFDIFSFEEIKKSANKFTEINFVRFLRTALINELPQAAVLIVDIKKKEEKVVEKIPAISEDVFNAFSSSSFAKAIPKEPLAKELKEEIKEELEKSSKEIEGVKPGHIYMKETEDLPQNRSFFESEFFSDFKNFFASLGEKTEDILSDLFSRISSLRLKTDFLGPKKLFQKIVVISASVAEYLSEKTATVFRKVRVAKIKIQSTTTTGVRLRNEIELRQINFGKFLPDFSRIKELFSKFSYEQKIYTILFLILIFVIPFLGIKIEKRIADKKAALLAQNAPQTIIPLEQDTNVNRLADLNTIEQGVSALSEIINLNGKIFFVGNSGVFDLEKNKLFSFPSEIGTIKNSAGMNDLNLILLIAKDKKAFSFSPTSGKFQSNLIEIPAESNITAGETYLTYLYLLDSQNNQIYRFPRAEGGFGAKIDWLRDGTDLSRVSDISVNENIFAISPNGIIKLFKGKRQDFSISETATPIVFDNLYVAKSNLEMYVLDKTNSRIIRLSPEGNILNQYHNEKIKDASVFSVDEETGTIYFGVEETVYSFNQ